MGIDWTGELVEQLELHWRGQLRPRLSGLTDAEYFWEPAPGAWNVRPRGESTAPVQGGSGAFTIDFAFPPPVPEPVTTIAWRMAHLIVGVFGARVASHFDGPAHDYLGHDYAGSAAAGLRQLDESYDAWMAGVRALGPDALARPVGAAEGQWAERTMATLVLHISREAIHHGAEIALLRDLFPSRG